MSQYQKLHGFKIGQAFLYKEAQNPEEYFATALKAEKFLRKAQKETAEGIYWQSDDSRKDLTLYSGSAGVLYFYIKLYETTNDDQYLEIVKKAAQYHAKHWKDFLTAEPTIPLPGAHDGLHFGLGGFSIALGEAYRVLKDEDTEKALREIGEHYKALAKTDANGSYFTGLTGLAMDGGIILTLLQQYQLLGDESIKELILSAADHFLAQGEKKEDGGLEFNGFKNVIPISLPNFEFGSSGAGYLLTKLYEFTKDEKFLEAAKATTVYLDSIKLPVGSGHLIPHHVYGPEDEEPVFYTSSCHGPAGTAKLYYQLYKLTGEEKWLSQIEDLILGLDAVGVPKIQSPGLWNNVCLCCGQAGQAQFFIGLYQATKNKKYLELARQAANVLLGEVEEEDGYSFWPMAWERVKPEEIGTGIGYYDGTAGVASALLQAFLNETEEFHWNRLLDDPFPEQ